MVWVEDIEFEKKMKPFIDEIYKKLFPKTINIIRPFQEDFDNERTKFLDKKLGIDTVLMFENGSILTFQEKSRRNNYLSFDDFTFEYYNDPVGKIRGEWFKLAAQCYFYGYANKQENGFVRFYLLNIFNLRLFINSKPMNFWREKIIQNDWKNSQSNFIPVLFSEMPKDCFFRSFDLKEKIAEIKKLGEKIDNKNQSIVNYLNPIRFSDFLPTKKELIEL